jgi:hypothetical protein
MLCARCLKAFKEGHLGPPITWTGGEPSNTWWVYCKPCWVVVVPK